MLSRLSPRVRMVLVGALALVTVLATTLAALQLLTPHASAAPVGKPFCATHATFCAETHETWDYSGSYTGHDEPSVLFYSSAAGSGNSNVYHLTLPTDPAAAPIQNGTGTTWSFQLHPAFWLGMVMCDTQSAPEFTNKCTPDSDTNIFDSPDKNSPKFIGKHPGGAFMEMQFYPPGWAPWPPGNSCAATQWCAALTIDSFNEDQNTGKFNNAACLNSVGPEPVNFAFITTSGVPHAPPDPVNATASTYTPNSGTDLFMNSGDNLTVDMHDTSAGFQVNITDTTASTSGSMTASTANQFGQVAFDPGGNKCRVNPYAFHPMYGSSSEHTRLTWTAHGYNVAFSDEIGHFEYCNAISGEGGTCTTDGAGDLDQGQGGAEDDNGCFDGSFSTNVNITGCLGEDDDFDGVSYQPGAWPGNGNDLNTSTPVAFTSPLFNGTTNYSRVAFETDLSRIEFATIPACQRHLLNPADPNPGEGCVNPPAGANFYPLYNANTSGGVCTWYEGGDGTPRNTFDGVSSANEFGNLLALFYPSTAQSVSYRYNDFRRVITNTCTE